MTRRRAFILVGAIATAGAVLTMVLYLRAVRLPSGYIDPDTIPRSVIEVRAREFRAAANDLTSRVISGRAFDVTFTEEATNAYLTRMRWQTGRAWYDELNIPPEIDAVQVQFQPRAVVVFGRRDGGWLSSVVSARARLKVTNGDLEARIVGVRSGRLPVPRALLSRWARVVDGRPFTIRVAKSRKVVLTEVHLNAGTIGLVGVPAEPD